MAKRPPSKPAPVKAPKPKQPDGVSIEFSAPVRIRKVPLRFSIELELEPHEASRLGFDVDVDGTVARLLGVDELGGKLSRGLRAWLLDRIATKLPDAIADVLGDRFEGGK